jgi:ATP-dependent Clp protease ATP-binding subunit ClpB
VDPNRLTRRSRRALASARAMAMDRGHAQLDAAHLMEALLDEGGTSICELVRRMGGDPRALRAEARAALVQQAPVCDGLMLSGQVFVTQRLLSVLDAAEHAALLRNEERVSVSHLLWALVEGGRPSERPTAATTGR